MMGVQRRDSNSSCADKDPVITQDGLTKSQLQLMMGRQRPIYNSRWADKDQFKTHDGQTMTRL